MEMCATLIDPERDEEFRRLGYTVAPLLSDAEVAETLTAIEAVQSEFQIGSRAEDHEDKFRVSYYDNNLEYQRTLAKVVRELIAPRLARVVKGFKVAAGGTFSKEPGAGEMGVHRDFTATLDPGEVTFTIWCPLADADESNGTLCLLPGSHRVTGHIMGLGVPAFFSEYEDKIRARSVPVPVKAGEALIFRTGMIHWSLANRSDRPRPAVHCLGIPQGSQHVIYLPDPEDGDRFDIRDLSATGVFDPSVPLPHLGFMKNQNRDVAWSEFERIVDGVRPAEVRPSIIGRFLRALTSSN